MASTQEGENSQELQPRRPTEMETEEQGHSVDVPVPGTVPENLANLIVNDSYISFASGPMSETKGDAADDAHSDNDSLGSVRSPLDDEDTVGYNGDGETEENTLAMASFEANNDGSSSDENSICSNRTTESMVSEMRQLYQSLNSNSFSSALSCHCQDDYPPSPLQQHPSATSASLAQQEQQGVKLRRQQSAPLTPSHSMEPPRSNNSIFITDSAEPVVVLGADISHLTRPYQFLVCAAGVFGFNLSFGYLQEFVAVEICNRNLGLFLAMMQFTGYTALSYGMRTFVNYQQQQKTSATLAVGKLKGTSSTPTFHSHPNVPSYMYWSLGILSAVDMAMTNMAMHYINYPAKTLMKSSRVVFTMIFGVLMAGKRYRLVDYLVVMCMVGGLAIFMQADATSNAVFEPLGVVMLTISLLCDGATNIMSETIMKNYGVGQDELIFRMYSLALIAVTAAATFKGDLRIGIVWLSRPGTYDEWNAGASEEEITWDVFGKFTMIVLFSSMGFFGSSCSAAITKNFGALTMSMTSTVRRAATLFISFFLFDNECTYEHVAGVVVFITALTTKSFMGRTNAMKSKIPLEKVHLSPPPKPMRDLEMQKALAGEHDGSTFTKSKGKTAGPGRRPLSGKPL